MADPLPATWVCLPTMLLWGYSVAPADYSRWQPGRASIVPCAVTGCGGTAGREKNLVIGVGCSSSMVYNPNREDDCRPLAGAPLQRCTMGWIGCLILEIFEFLWNTGIFDVFGTRV